LLLTDSRFPLNETTTSPSGEVSQRLRGALNRFSLEKVLPPYRAKSYNAAPVFFKSFAKIIFTFFLQGKIGRKSCAAAFLRSGRPPDEHRSANSATQHSVEFH
jgi:hypothetical protein